MCLLFHHIPCGRSAGFLYITMKSILNLPSSGISLSGTSISLLRNLSYSCRRSPYVPTRRYRRGRFIIQSIFFIIIYWIWIPFPVDAFDTDIVVTEVAAYEQSDHEWIEITNKGTSPVDITGWKFFEDGTNHGLAVFRGDAVIDPGEYAVIADVAANTSADYPTFTGTLIDSSWQTLNENGELIALKNKEGATIESFTYGTAQNHSLERIDNTKNDYTSVNWRENSTGNSIGFKITAHTQQSPPSQVEQQKEIAPPVIPSPSWKAARGDVVINEFVSDPTDEESEWVELYNISSHTVDMAGWTLEDGSKTKHILTGTLGASGRNRFFVVGEMKTALNNSGDIIILRNDHADIIDEVAYGSWNDGTVSDNAPSASDPFSVARSVDGQNTFNAVYDFNITSTPTKGDTNIITEVNDPKVGSIKEVIISEIFPNPTDIHTEEFIELHNTGTSIIDIQGWELVSGNGKRYEFGIRSLRGGEYISIPKSESGITLKNRGGDSVKLYPKGYERPTSSVIYHDDAPRDQSFSFGTNGRFVWTLFSTPGSVNVLKTENKTPSISVYGPATAHNGEDIFFDASDSSDPDGDTLSFYWDFGDGFIDTVSQPIHTFFKTGSYDIQLRVSDGMHTERHVHHIVISASVSSTPVVMSNAYVLGSVVLNEILPNPKGSDTGEFIELKNSSDHTIDIEGWVVQSEGSSKSFRFSSATPLVRGALVFLERKKSGISLVNGIGHVLLFDNFGEKNDDVTYEDAPSGQSLSRTSEGDLVWSSKPTPGKDNNVDFLVKEDSSSDGEIDTASSGKEKITIPSSGKKNIVMKGVISVPPGVFGKRIAYLAPSGIRLYISSPDVPTLQVGDVVQVAGILKSSSTGLQLFISKTHTIQVLSHTRQPVPHIIEEGGTLEGYDGKLVTLAGEVSDIQWPSVILEHDGEDITLSIKRGTDLKKSFFVKGAAIEVTGIVQKEDDTFRMLPRSSEDIVKKHTPIVQENENISAHPEKRQKSLAYLIALLVAAILLFGGMFIRRKFKRG